MKDFVIDALKDEQKKKFAIFSVSAWDVFIFVSLLATLVILVSLYYTSQETCNDFINFQPFDQSCSNFDSISDNVNKMILQFATASVQGAGSPIIDTKSQFDPNVRYNCSSLWTGTFTNIIYIVPSENPAQQNYSGFASLFSFLSGPPDNFYTAFGFPSVVNCPLDHEAVMKITQTRSPQGNSSLMVSGSLPACQAQYVGDVRKTFESLSNTVRDACLRYYETNHLMRCRICTKLDAKTVTILVLLALVQGVTTIFRAIKFLVNRRNKRHILEKDSALLEVGEDFSAHSQ